MFKNQLVCFLCILFFASKAQNHSFYPEMINNLQSQRAWINPGYVSEMGDYSANFQSNFRSVNRGKVGVYTFDGATWFRHDTSAYGFRVLVTDEKEGPYISRPRGYLNFALQQALSKRFSLYSGASIGFFSTNISAVSATTATNFFLPDGNIGLGLKSKKTDVGFALMQAFNNAVSPASAALRLRRYYHYYVQYTENLTPDLSIDMAVFYRQFTDIPDQLSVAITGFYKRSIGIGTNYHSSKGFSFFMLTQHEIGISRYQLMLAYNSGSGSVSPALHRSMEVGVGVLFPAP